MMVRIQDADGNFVEQFVDEVTPAATGDVEIGNILINGNVTVAKAMISPLFFKKTDGPIVIKINAVNATSYALNGCSSTPTENAGEFTVDISGYAPGRYTIVAQANGNGTFAKKVITLNIFEDTASESYPVISGVTATAGTLPNQICVDISSNQATGTRYKYILEEPNNAVIQSSGTYLTESSKIFTLGPKQYGNYLIQAYAKRNFDGAFDDGIIYNYNFARPAAAASITADVTGSSDFNNVTLGQTINFVASATIPGLDTATGETIQYSFYRNDANGFMLFKDWTSAEVQDANKLTWKPSMAGKYTIQVRAKGSHAGSYEAVKDFHFTVTGGMSTLSASDITVKFYDVNTGAEIAKNNLVARMPVEVRATVPEGNSLYYKYIVYDTQMGGYEISPYSPHNTVLWSPRKAMSFRLYVFARSFNSFGSADVVKQVDVTAQ